MAKAFELISQVQLANTNLVNVADASLKVDDSWNEWPKTMNEPLDLQGCDLSNNDLLAFDFRNAKLSGTSFRNCIFALGRFENYDLRNAIFAGATTYKYSFFFEVANLNGADFIGARNLVSM